MATNGKSTKRNATPMTDWETNPRWNGVKRPYGWEDVERLRGTMQIECTLARHGAETLWKMLHSEAYLPALGALTGNQAVQQVRAGLKAIYVSGWQVAADANNAGEMYPDQSLYPSDSVPAVVRKINRVLTRADQIHHAEGKNGVNWFVPLVADAEAGFGGNLNAFELMKAMIEAGAACVHFEDQLSSAKKCGHLGGKVLVPTTEAIQKLVAARLAADVMGVPTLVLARTDANSAHHWKKKLDDATIGRFQTELAAMGYKFQFVTLAGFHALNLSMFDLARAYKQSGMKAYSALQEREFSNEQHGYEGAKHQRFVGTGYFDLVTQVVAGGLASTTALANSTEAEQFLPMPPPEIPPDEMLMPAGD